MFVIIVLRVNVFREFIINRLGGVLRVFIYLIFTRKVGGRYCVEVIEK